MATYKHFVDSDSKGPGVAVLAVDQPQLVIVTVPREMIDQAQAHPTIDWNAVVRQAVAISLKGQTSETTSPPE